MLEQRVQQHFIDGADLNYQAAQLLSQPIEAAIQAILACVTNGSKVLACGSGLSSLQAQQFAAMCVVGFERERPELAAVALIHERGAKSGVDIAALARQVRALGQAGDLLLAITTDAGDPTLLGAVEAAHEREMTVVALCGRDSGELASLLHETDVQICVPHDRQARVREMHNLVLHCLCDGVDAQLLGEQEVPL